MFKTTLTAALLACLLCMTGCKSDEPTTELTLIAAAQDAPTQVPAVAEDDGFVSLFNGKDLTGWTPKIKGFDLGEDPKQTFRVVDGVIQVNYSNYDTFDRQFGHLFCDTEYGSYVLRLEYRFLGDKQIDGNPGGWAYMNSGVMIHGEDPKAMPKNKDFPDSIEVQLLGQKEDGPDRTTANICTPGTHYVDLDDKLIKNHCVRSTSKTFRGEQWVQLEIEVHGSKKIIHRVNGEVVFEYKNPQLNDGTLLEKGSISLQSESHACEFRNIEIKVLEK